MFEMSEWEKPPPPVIAPPEEVVDCLVEDAPGGAAQPVRWSEYLPDGLLADLLAQSAEVDPEHRGFEALERIGGWERVIAWAQARQLREMTSFMHSAEERNAAWGASTSQAHDSAVAEVGLMLRVSARTAAARVDTAQSLCDRLPATLAALENGRITLAKARIIAAETLIFPSSTPRRSNNRYWPRHKNRFLGSCAPRLVVPCCPLNLLLRRNGPSRPSASVECRCGPSPTAWPPCRPTFPPLRPSACTRCSTSTPAGPGSPAMSAAWMPAVLMPWSISFSTHWLCQCRHDRSPPRYDSHRPRQQLPH